MKYCKNQNHKIIGKIDYHEIQKSPIDNENNLGKRNNRRVLMIHTGGTIGMLQNQQGNLQPTKDMFLKFIREYPYFEDQDQTYFNDQTEYIITPTIMGNRQIEYKFIEMDKIIDSVNMNLTKINHIMSIIQQNYHKYDGFVILHGTDTLAHTASSLSFMIENLKKTIVITGAQVPIQQIRNDSINNLLGSLLVAGLYTIPEILLVFDHKIYRGNRVTKVSASSFSSYSSPNEYLIGQLGFKIYIRWQGVLPCRMNQPTNFVKLKQEVTLIKLTPFNQNVSINPECKYIVIESFGVGNIPTEGKLYDWLKSNAEKDDDNKAIVVNISQVLQSVILNLYSTGVEAEKLGLISGSDMTSQAATSKLSYLLSKGIKTNQELKKYIMMNLRGQLTSEEKRVMIGMKDDYIENCMTILDQKCNKEINTTKQIIRNIAYPTLLYNNITRSSIERMNNLGTNINFIYADGGTQLHYFCKETNIQNSMEIYLQYLLEKNIGINDKDNYGCTALYYALENKNYDIAAFLYKKGGIIHADSNKIFQVINVEKIELLQALNQYGDKFKYYNEQKRNCVVYAIINSKIKVYNFFKNKTILLKDQNLKQKDIYGKDVNFYLQQFGYTIDSKISQSIQLQQKQ